MQISKKTAKRFLTFQETYIAELESELKYALYVINQLEKENKALKNSLFDKAEPLPDTEEEKEPEKAPWNFEKMFANCKSYPSVKETEIKDQKTKEFLDGEILNKNFIQGIDWGTAPTKSTAQEDSTAFKNNLDKFLEDWLKHSGVVYNRD